MFRGHIGLEIRARAVFMSEISGHDFASIKFRNFEKKVKLECIKFRDILFSSICQYVPLTSEL